MVIKNWPEPKSCAEVKSFLQTVQFHSKFLQGKPGEMSYPEITKPLRELTKKGSKFKWEKEQKHSFHNNHTDDPRLRHGTSSEEIGELI